MRFSLFIWLGVVGDHLIYPYVVPKDLPIQVTKIWFHAANSTDFAQSKGPEQYMKNVQDHSPAGK